MIAAKYFVLLVSRPSYNPKYCISFMCIIMYNQIKNIVIVIVLRSMGADDQITQD